jgi:hypothetical protein
MAKQEFNIIINTGDLSQGKSGFITYHKVSSVEKFRKFANEKFPKWLFATVYDKSTRDKIEVIKP